MQRPMISRLAVWTSGWRWFQFAAADACQPLRHAVGGCDQEVSAATSRVADFQVEDGLGAFFRRFIQHGIERRIEQVR